MVLSKAYILLLVIVGLLILLAGAMAVWAFMCFNDLRILSEKPSKTSGRLIKKARKRQFKMIANITQTQFTYWIHYEFKDSRGKIFPGKSNVTAEVYETILPGKEVNVVYDHDKPSRNFLETAVEHEKFKHLMLGLIGSLIAVLVAFLAVVQ